MIVRPVLFPPSRRRARRFIHLFLTPAILFTLAAPIAALAQGGVVTGRVTDAETGEPVAEVAVDLITSGRERVGTTTSDASGQFRIEVAAPGGYSLVFSRLGYEIRRVDGVTIQAAGTFDAGTVTLVSRALRVNPIVVTPSRTEEKVQKAPASTWVVDTRDIQSQPATSPVDHVRRVPGADIASTGLTQRSVVARGFNGVFSGGLLVLTDYRWASVPSLRFNAYNLIPAADEDIDRIEFVLGPGSALYGPNVSQGVMHLLTRSPLTHRGTTLTAMGGERDVMQLGGRHASAIGTQVGVKASANYMQGRDWEFHDPVEEAARANAIAGGADPDTLLIGARDFDAERFGGEVRVDYEPSARTNLVVSGGLSQLGSSIEMTGIGAAQARDWQTSYGQARLRSGNLFAQTYINLSDAGDTYLLRDGARLTDKSFLYVAQLQHATRMGERQRFIYGADLIQTVPRTEGTINGRNEDDDDITEIGGYVQSESELRENLDLVVAARVDDHSRVDETVFSPRAGVVYQAAPGHNLRLTYNRAFNQPSSNNLFLDVRSARDLGGLPYDVRATGVPKDGFQFARDVGGRPLMRSPFTPSGLGGPAQQLPLDATVFWSVVQNLVPALAGVPAPNATQVGTVMRTLNPTSRSFSTVADVGDVSPQRPQINNTAEVGYKGFIANRLSLGIDLYYSRIEDFISPLFVATPSVFLERASLAAYLVTQGFTPAQAAALAAAVAGIDNNAAVTGIPLGTVTPISTVGDPYDIFVTYRNFGTVDLWGSDLGATFVATDQLSFTATYSFVNKNLFKNLDNVADIALNAPMNKATLSAKYFDERSGWIAEVRGRYVDLFPMISGVYVGTVAAYTLCDVSVSYALPFQRAFEVSLSASNVFDNLHREFVGAPELGRLVVGRVRWNL